MIQSPIYYVLSSSTLIKISGERFVITKGDRIDFVGAVINEKSVTPWTSLFRRVRDIAKSDVWLRLVCPSVWEIDQEDAQEIDCGMMS
jgi:hypothetical protein